MNTVMDITVNSLQELEGAARRLLDALPADARVLAFHGGMGVGKTTFIAAIARVLGIDPGQVNSPTFAIINHYESGDVCVYHFDMYRLDGDEEAVDAGVADYLDSGNWCFIEWPENTPGLLPADTVHVYMSEGPDGSRTITLNSGQTI